MGTTIFVTHGHSNLFSNFSGLKFYPLLQKLFFILKLQQNICQPFFQRKKEHTKKKFYFLETSLFWLLYIKKYYKILLPSVNEGKKSVFVHIYFKSKKKACF